MYTLVGIIIILVVLVFLGALYTVFKPRLKFIITGLDSGFSLSDVNLLWNVAQICELEQPTSLFFSMASLTKCMTQITNQNQAEGTESNPKNQRLMTKLFDYRTKIQNESDDKKGLNSTKFLDKGQTLRIILPGKGVFVSEIVNNGNQMIINVPKQKGLIPISGEEWVGKVISVYLWRNGDARYVFDTTVLQHGLFLGKSAIYLKHSSNLVRTQKRKSIRAKCEIYANLYIMKKNNDDPEYLTTIETKNGYRCLLEDISESGALIRIGGKGAQNVKIKLQFSIQNKLILMSGVVRTVDYNETENQSLLHFECTNIDSLMRNEILSYVYNMLPENEKEVLEALSQTDDDLKQDSTLLESKQQTEVVDSTQVAATSAESTADNTSDNIDNKTTEIPEVQIPESKGEDSADIILPDEAIDLNDAISFDS